MQLGEEGNDVAHEVNHVRRKWPRRPVSEESCHQSGDTRAFVIPASSRDRMNWPRILSEGFYQHDLFHLACQR